MFCDFCIPTKRSSFWNFVTQLKLCINLLGNHLMKTEMKGNSDAIVF